MTFFPSADVVYNAYLEAAIILFDAALYAFLFLQRKEQDEEKRSFRQLVLALLFATVFDVIVSNSINHPALLPYPVHRAMRACNGISGTVAAYFLLRYVLAFVRAKTDKLSEFLVVAPLPLCLFVWALNPFLHWIYDYRINRLGTESYLFRASHFYFALYYILLSVFATVFFRKRYDRTQMVAFLLNIVFVIALFFVQMLYMPYLMVAYYVGSIAVYTMFFALETPAYDRVVRAKEELEQAREKADKAAEEAREANRLKSAFLTGMSHEIITPVGNILSMDGLILKKTTQPRMRTLALDLQKAATRLNRSVGDILTYSRIEAGMLQPILLSYETRELLDEICKNAYPTARQKGLQLEVASDAAVPRVLLGDMEHIVQAVTNLVNNALQFTLKGRVEVFLSGEKKEEGFLLSLRVTDTGIGIPPEDMERVFTSFYKANAKELSGYQGAGLGLTVTKRLIERMEGEISLTSQPMNGSVVTVTVPQGIEDASPMGAYEPARLFDTLDERLRREEKESNAYEGALDGKKILVVDDTLVNLTIARGLLKETGAQVEVVTTGELCVERARGERFDCILLDEKMPEMSGMKTLQVLRTAALEEGGFASGVVPVILMDATASRTDVKAFMEQGVAGFLQKPLQLHEVIERILQVTG